MLAEEETGTTRATSNWLSISMGGIIPKPGIVYKYDLELIL
jgi:hypothetical protein